jgi:iron(III) transport system permease protein
VLRFRVFLPLIAVSQLRLRITLPTIRIYGYVGGFRDPNGMGIATSLSMALLGFALVGLVLQNYFTRKQHFTVITGKSAPIEVTDLRRWRIPLAILVGVFAVIVLAAPVLAVAITSMMRALGLAIRPENMTLGHYGRLLQMPLVARSLRNSFFLALSVPTIGVFAAVILTFVKRKGRMPGRNAIDYIVSMPYAIPGIVIGVAMILAWIRPVMGLSIYNTIWILFIAYIVRFMIFPMRTVGAAWKQLDSSLEEAARISGAGEARTLRDVSGPLISTGIISGWLLAFMPALTELTLSILLYSPRNETIGVTAFNVMQEGLVTVAGAYAMIIVVVVVTLNIVLNLITAKRARRLNPVHTEAGN